MPFAAIKVFFDPSVPYGLQFEEGGAEGDVTRQLGSARAQAVSPDTAPDEKGKLAAPRRRRWLEVKPRRGQRTRKARAEKDEGRRDRPIAAQAARGPCQDEQPDIPANDAKIVQLDRFRKK